MRPEIKEDFTDISSSGEVRESKRPTRSREQRPDNSLLTNIAAKLQKKYTNEQAPTFTFPTNGITSTIFNNHLSIEDIGLLTLTSKSSQKLY